MNDPYHTSTSLAVHQIISKSSNLKCRGLVPIFLVQRFSRDHLTCWSQIGCGSDCPGRRMNLHLYAATLFCDARMTSFILPLHSPTQLQKGINLSTILPSSHRCVVCMNTPPVVKCSSKSASSMKNFPTLQLRVEFSKASSHSTVIHNTHALSRLICTMIGANSRIQDLKRCELT